jgi:predicted dehydrogenase
MSDPLRLGLIGAGVIADVHAGSFKVIPNASITHVYADSEEDRAAFATKRGAAPVDTVDALLGADVDAVMVCTPTEKHADYTIRALEAGKHVFCEKPMALAIGDADRMIAAADRAGKVLMIGLVLRWFHEFTRLHQLVEAGTVGEPRIIRTSRVAGFPRGRDDWYADYSRSGGLAVDMLTHDYDFLRWCFGEVDHVMARGLANDGHDHLDYCLVLLRFTSGMLAHVEGSWAHPAGTFYTRAELSGTEGLVTFDSRQTVPLTVSPRVVAGGGPGVAVPESPVNEGPYMQEMRHFLNVVRGAEALAVTPRDARAALAIALAVKQSIETGKPVRPADVGGAQ